MECIVISESRLKIMLNRLDMARYELGSGDVDCARASTRAAFRHIFEDAGEQAGFDTEGARLFVQLYASKEGGCEIFVTKLEGGAWDEQQASARDAGVGQDLRGEALAHEKDRVDSAPLTASEESLLSPHHDGNPNHGHPENGLTKNGLTKNGLPKSGAEALLRMIKEVDMTQPNGDGVAGGRWYRFDSLGDLLACCRALKGRGLGHDGAAYIDEGGAGRYYLELREGREEGSRSPAIDLAAAEFGTLADREATELYLAEYGRCLCESGAVGMLGRC